MIRSLNILNCKQIINITKFRGIRRPPPRSPFDSYYTEEDAHSATFKHSDRYALTPLAPNELAIVPKTQTNSGLPYPKEIVAFLDQFVIGQDLAKKTLAVGVYQHYKRVQYNQIVQERLLIRQMVRDAIAEEDRNEQRTERKRGKKQNIQNIKKMKETDPGVSDRCANFSLDINDNDLVLEKSNIVLLGPSGSGKTYLTQKLAEALDVPIAMCDCTTLTQAGYVGEDVESVVQKLIQMANGEVERAEQGIVFLDEFDKIYTSADPLHTSGNRDVGGKGVQQALLKLVEGTRIQVKNPLQPNQKLEIDTSNILFIASGAFSNIERVVARRLDKRSLGFSSNSIRLGEDLDSTKESEALQSKIRLLSETDHGDLISFGMVPELVGRFPVLVPFHPLSEDMLRQVMTEPKNNIISQSKKLFAMDKIDLIFSDCAISEMAKIAVERKTGARALRSIMEKVLLNAKYECPGSLEGSILINGEVVRGKAEFRKKNNNKH